MLDRELRLFQLTMGYARKLVRDIDPADFHAQPAPGVNTPAWIVGHLAVVADFGARLLGEDARLPDAWSAKFGPGSHPSSNPADNPTKDELLEAFEAASARLAEIAAAAPAKRLEARQRTPFFKDELPTLADFLAHILTTHPMLHLGQLSTWRRVRGLGSVLGF